MGKEESSPTTDKSQTFITDNSNGGNGRRPSPQIRHNSVASSVSSRLEEKTKEIGTNVFQIHGEQKRKGQFKETLEALKVFSSHKYIKHINYISLLFNDLEELCIKKSEEPQTKKISVKDKKGVTRRMTK